MHIGQLIHLLFYLFLNLELILNKFAVNKLWIEVFIVSYKHNYGDY